MSPKIIHIVPSIVNEASGPSYSVVRLCESIIERGKDVTLAVLSSPGDVTFRFVKSFARSLGPNRLGCSSQMRKWLFNAAAKGNVHLCHNHSLWMMPNVYPGQVVKKYHIPYIVSPRGTLSSHAMHSGSSMKMFFWPFIQKPALKNVTCFHATSESEYNDIRILGFRQPVTIIPNGVDLPILLPPKKLEQQTLLFLGRIHPIKGLDILLSAWQIVQGSYPNWRLCIVGPDNCGYLTQMKQLALNLKLERIEFKDPLYGDKKWAAYHNADLFVLPSYSENFGMSVSEALASGTPVIVSNRTPWERVVSENAGWYFELGVEGLSQCLMEAFNNSPEKLRERGINGRNWMDREFSWNSVAVKMIQTYDWIMGNGPKPICVKSD